MLEPITIEIGRTKVMIYGGLNTIGGNCVVVKSPTRSVMLDQGVNFMQLKNFYGFSIQPESVEELREMGVLPPREAYNDIEEVYISHLHLDHLGSLNFPNDDISVYLPSVDIAEALSHSWWFGWKQQLLPQTLSFVGLKDIKNCKGVEFTTVSHSAYPSYAFKVDTDDISLIYTGDFRVRSLRFSDTLSNLSALAEDGVDIAIIEGTNFGRRMNYLTSNQFEALFNELLENYKQKVLFLTAHPLDFEATLTVIELLWRHDYVPVFENPYYTQLLDIMIEISNYRLENDLIFTPMRTSGIKTYENFEIEYLSELKDMKIAFFIPISGIRDMETILRLLDIADENILHVTILGEPSEEEWIIEEKKLENWLSLLGITSYRIHLSGHYHPYEFKDVIEAIKPKEIIPIHTLVPKTMLNLFRKYKST